MQKNGYFLCKRKKQHCDLTFCIVFSFWYAERDLNPNLLITD